LGSATSLDDSDDDEEQNDVDADVDHDAAGVGIGILRFGGSGRRCQRVLPYDNASRNVTDGAHR